MAKIAPFRGIRYDPTVVDANDVTSPPYDVISPADNDYFHNRHPKNMVRLILGKELPEDGPADNRFTRAASYMREWLADGSLKQDETPAIYVYEQHYQWKGQPKSVRGFIALVKIQSYDENIVLPHENTLAKPKSHLIPLIRATKSNLDSVYALYPDPEHVVDSVLDRVAELQPSLEATDKNGVRHRLWAVSDEKDIALIADTLADRQIVIADGHHRYETSLGYRDELRASDGNPPVAQTLLSVQANDEQTGVSALLKDEEKPYDYVMMTLVNVYAPDVIIFPTHRMVRNLPNDALDRLDDKLREGFDLVESTRDSLQTDMERFGGKGIGIYRPGRACIAVPRDGAVKSIPGSPALKGLDLSVLHQLILDRILGIDAERLRQEANVVYSRDESEAFDSVENGDFQLAFLLNPIKLETVLNVAQAGDRMPQKATYFYPKLLSGLVMRRIEW